MQWFYKAYTVCDRDLKTTFHTYNFLVNNTVFFFLDYIYPVPLLTSAFEFTIVAPKQ